MPGNSNIRIICESVLKSVILLGFGPLVLLVGMSGNPLIECQILYMEIVDIILGSCLIWQPV